MKLLFEAVIKYILGVVIIGLILFIPAGTLNFWNAWLFMALLFIPMFFVMIVLWLKNKDLLRKRISKRENEKTQKIVINLSLLIIVISFVVTGLDFKYDFSRLPNSAVIVGSITLVISYGLFIEVMRENTYLSKIVEIQENQKVIDTGLYSIVRHPMYMATTILYLSFPIVLGSLLAFIILLPFPFILVRRIKNEEDVLEKGLDGYKEYKQKVKYKMIPFIW